MNIAAAIISVLGSARASRAHCGASPQCSGRGKVRDGEGAIASTRGRARSPEPEIAHFATIPSY
jgi:hypothetical protein